MAAVRSNLLLRGILSASPSLPRYRPKLRTRYTGSPSFPAIRIVPVRCMASDSGDGDGRKFSSRLSQVQQLLREAEERASSAGNEPIPNITLDHVTVNFARSGGPGGQNVNKVNTKVDMRFNVKNAYWLSDRVREKIMQMEKNRINKDGEIVISSTKTRTQKGNIEDALAKLQAIIDAASYVPPPPSEEQKKKIAKIRDYRARRCFHKRNHLGEAKIVGTEMQDYQMKSKRPCLRANMSYRCSIPI